MVARQVRLVPIPRHGSDVHTFHADAQGTTRLLTDAGGAVATEYGFDAFGVPLYESGNVANDYRYVGEPVDPDLGLTYLRARHYAPRQGRFLTTDPFDGDNRMPVTLHDYLYAGSDPVNRSDPAGLFLSLVEVQFTSKAQSQLRSRDTRRGIRTIRRGFWRKVWDAYMVGEPLQDWLLEGIRDIVPDRAQRFDRHYFIYVNKRRNKRGLRYDVGAGKNLSRLLNAGIYRLVLPGKLTIQKTRFSDVRRDASRGPWWVGSFNRKQRNIWRWLAVPLGFAAGASAPIMYSLSFRPIVEGNLLTGKPWQKININCYTWTAYAAGVALFATGIPIR